MNIAFSWNYTKCRAIHDRGGKKGKLYYNFYIIDYDLIDDDKSNIIEMRNNGLTKTKYFYTKKEAMKFLHEYQDKLYAKDIRKVARKLEKPIKGDIINLDTIRKGVKFLKNRTKINLEKDFGVKRTV